MKLHLTVRIIVALCMALALSSSAFAQEGDPFIPIELGEAINGSLTTSDFQRLYTFEADAETFVTIRLESEDFDTYMVLLDSDNTVIAEDDDGGGELNSLIELALPQTDTYTIIATSLRAFRSDGGIAAEGDFTLRLNADDAPAPEPMPQERVDGGTIRYNETVRGEIGDDFQPVAYTFEASAGDVVTVTASSADFDAYLFLERDGDPLIRDDDGGGDSDAQISDFALPGAGTYTIVVDSFGNVINVEPGSGAFTLTLVSGDDPIEPTPEPRATDEPRPEMPGEEGDLSYGQTIDATLTEQARTREYTFTGQAGDIVTIDMRSFTIDTYLTLLDTEGNIILEDDDSGGDLNARIGPFELTDDGTYTVEANSYSNVFSDLPTAGEFSLRIERVAVEAVDVTEEIIGELNSDLPFTVYRFEGTSGDVVTVSLDTESFAVFARITGAGGAIDQQSFGGSQLIGPIVLPEDGGYIVTVSSYDTFEPMPFSLDIDRVVPERIDYDTQATSSFGDDAAKVYTFTASAGDVINVLVSSETGVDTSLALSTPDGTVIASDDDSGEGFNPELNRILLPEDGDYAIVVQPYIPGDVGSITLELQNNGVMSINEDIQVVRISDKQGAGSVVFDGSAGETVRLNARPLTETGAEPIIIVTQNGVELARNTVGQVERLILEFTVPEDGPVNVRVEELYSFNAIIEFALERVE